MEGANKYGKISPSIRAIGRITRPMEEAGSSIPMETSTKANGKMIKPMAKESTIIMTAPAIQDNGFRIFRKVTESKNGLMGPHTRGIYFNNHSNHHNGLKHG